MLSDEYIFQEIQEQERIAAFHRRLASPQWPTSSGRLIATGAGDSYCAALFCQWLLEKRGGVAGLPSLEASRAAQYLTRSDALVAISVSGRTPRVLEAARRALIGGAQVVAITDNLESPLAELAPEVWPIHASPAEELQHTSYHDKEARQYVGYHHDVAQTKTFWAVLLTIARAAQVEIDWQRLLSNASQLLSISFYQQLLTRAEDWARSAQTFFLASGWAMIPARFAMYKMYEFNRVAYFNEIEEYCHTHYFITRPGDTVVFLVDNDDSAARAAEIVPVLRRIFSARVVWIQPQSLSSGSPPAACRNQLDLVNLPEADQTILHFLNFILALQWITYFIGRIDAPDINTFHGGYDTERLVAGTLQAIRRSAIRPVSGDLPAGKLDPIK
jgi:fructoselysine-6-P-deglycase FrlB-like protein